MRARVLLLLLLTCCVASSNGCSPFTRRRDPDDAWKKDSECRHIDKINSIVNDVTEKLENYALEVETSDSRGCHEESKLKLMEILRDGERDVRKCIEFADSKVSGDDCCYRVQSQVGEESTRVALIATRCFVIA